MNDPIPSKPGIIHDNMNLAIPKLRRLLHQLGDIIAIRDIADDGERAPRFGGINGVRDGVGLFC